MNSITQDGQEDNKVEERGIHLESRLAVFQFTFDLLDLEKPFESLISPQ
jgi:hypothetical protein